MFGKFILILLSVFLIASCNPSKSVKSEDQTLSSDSYLVYEEAAMKAILQTKETLGKNLMEAMRSGGVEYAVSFCADRAQQLTDSLGAVNNVTIRRVAANNRNPQNAATSADLAYMQKLEDLMKNGGSPVQAWSDEGDYVVVRQPIFTDELCLNCHGKVNETLLPENFEIIKIYYPEDKAFGFELQSLRGIWVVEMKK